MKARKRAFRRFRNLFVLSWLVVNALVVALVLL